MEMHCEQKNVLVLALPFAGVAIPLIQLPLFESYLNQRNIQITTKHLQCPRPAGGATGDLGLKRPAIFIGLDEVTPIDSVWILSGHEVI